MAIPNVGWVGKQLRGQHIDYPVPAPNEDFCRVFSVAIPPCPKASFKHAIGLYSSEPSRPFTRQPMDSPHTFPAERTID